MSSIIVPLSPEVVCHDSMPCFTDGGSPYWIVLHPTLPYGNQVNIRDVLSATAPAPVQEHEA
jgi:hypothetical protein